MNKNLAVVIFLFLLIGCQSNVDQSVDNQKIEVQNRAYSYKPTVTYAKHFALEVRDHMKILVVHNPWSAGDTLVSYVLYPRGAPVPDVPWADFRIPLPVEEVVATSSPQVGLIGLLEELERISGVAEAQYIFNPIIVEKVQEGTVSEVGAMSESNLEILFDLDPDLLMKTGFEKVQPEDARLIEAGIPISYHLEWMETDLLARAEWLKFVAAFLDQDAKADSIFRSVEQEYLRALSLAAQVDHRPAIMTGSNFKGTWYMPSADNYLTKLIHDAGGEYHYKNQHAAGSLPLSFEVVLDKMIDADYWLGPRAVSLEQLESQDERYTLFKAFQDGNVYTYDKRTNATGGNDYWESGMTRPDLILKDAIKIFHPDVLPDHELHYHRKLE